MIKKHFWLLSMLKTVVPHDIFVETVIRLLNSSQIKNCNLVFILIVFFDFNFSNS